MDGFFYALGFLGVAALVTIGPVVAVSQTKLGKGIGKAVTAHRAKRAKVAAAAIAEAEKAAKEAERVAQREAAPAGRRGAGRRASRPAAPAAPPVPTPASTAPKPGQLGLFLRGVSASGRGVRAANTRYQALAAGFTQRTHPPVAAKLRSWSSRGVLSWLADRLDPGPGNVAPPSAAPHDDPPPTRASPPPAAASPPTERRDAAPPPAKPADPSTQLFGGNHVMGDILVPDKRVQAAMEAVASIADFVPAAEGGAWQLERMLQSLPELARSVSNAIAFMTSNLDARGWDPELIRKLYAASGSFAGGIAPLIESHETLRTVYKPDFDAAETGGRRRVDQHQAAFDPQYATTSS